MRQILFQIELSRINGSLPDIPVYGYGLMLFMAYLWCTWLAKRLCRREGIDGALIPDLAIWLVVAGILGGRMVYVIQYWQTTSTNVGFDRRPLLEVIKLWDGGLVLYGAIAGGAVGFFAYDRFVLQKHKVSRWKMLDIIAPCVALGVALGRIGCLFTGCCYGNVACEGRPHIEFPLFSNTKPPQLTAPAGEMIRRGYQAPLGFLFREGTLEVEGVDHGSAAEKAGLLAGDVVFKVNGIQVLRQEDVVPDDDGRLKLDLLRGEPVPIEFTPTSIGLNPTQIYETISMSLLLFFLLSYFPYRRRDGELMVYLMLGYGVHRFLNEMLRTDTAPVAFGLTLSQNVSIAVLLAAGVLAWFVWRRPRNVEIQLV